MDLFTLHLSVLELLHVPIQVENFLVSVLASAVLFHTSSCKSSHRE